MLSNSLTQQQRLKKLIFSAHPQATIQALNISNFLATGHLHSFDHYLVDVDITPRQRKRLLSRFKAYQLLEKSTAITQEFDAEVLSQMLAVGAQGYLLASQPNAEIIEQLQHLNQEQLILAPEVWCKLLGHFRRVSLPSSVAANRPTLTSRESDVLQKIGAGLTIEESAKSLNLAQSTVASYVKQIYKKLNINNRAQAAIAAAQLGLLSLDACHD